jgi:adenylylsulfate kinase-like enzyme
VVVPVISLFGVGCGWVRRITKADFVEIYYCCPDGACKPRGPKGLYKKAWAGEIRKFTCINSLYEESKHAKLEIKSAILPVEERLAAAMACIDNYGLTDNY